MQKQRGVAVEAVDTIGFGSVVGMVSAVASSDPTHGTITGTIAGLLYIIVRNIAPILIGRLKSRIESGKK